MFSSHNLSLPETEHHMPEKPWFEDWFDSPYYHLLYNHRNELEALAFIRQLIAHLQPAQGSQMLDVACGKGRHSRALAEMGFDVTGIDLSFSSIYEAKQTESDTLHFFQHDMRLPFWIRYFDYAFNFFTSFGYFKTLREHNNAIRTIANSLKPSGKLVIDYLNVRYSQDHLVKEMDKVVDDVTFHITKWQDDEHFYKKIQVSDNGDAKGNFNEKVMKFSLDDFTNMFAHQHLIIQEVLGDYSFSNYDSEKSPRLIMIVKKTG